MRKRLVRGSGIVVLLLVIVSCGSKEAYKDRGVVTYNKIEEQKEVIEATRVSPETSATADMEEIVEQERSEDRGEEEAVTKEMETMTPIFTTIALYMAKGNIYDPNEEECYKSVLYMMASGVKDIFGADLWKEKEGMLYIKEETMQAIATVAFADRESFKNVEKNAIGLIEYDKKERRYIVEEQQQIEVQGRILTQWRNEDGTYFIQFELMDCGRESLATVEFMVVRNVGQCAKVAPYYQYRVKEVKKLVE